MPRGSAKKIAVAVLAILTIGLGIVAVILGINLANGGLDDGTQISSSSTTSADSSGSQTSSESSSTTSDIAVANVCCGGGSCDNGFTFGPDYEYSFGSCADRLAAVEAEQQSSCSGSSEVSCPSEPTPTPTPTNPGTCVPSVSGNTVIGYDGCSYEDSFNGRRKMTGPGDECYVNQGDAQGGYTSGSKTGPIQWTADPGKCYCQQVDLVYNGQIYGTKASGGWDSSCTSSGTSSNSTTTTSKQCGDSCSSDSQCPNNHICSSGTCQLPFCAENPNSCTTDGCTVTSDISIVKTSELSSCSIDGNAVINYKILVDNLGSDTETIDQVVDTFDSRISASQISSISNSGVVSGNTITWDGPFTVNSGGSLSFTYTITLTTEQIAVFDPEGGIQNVVSVTYGTDSRTFTLLTPLTCLPNTGIFDEPLGIMLVGLLLILSGIAFNRMRFLNQVYLSYAHSMARRKELRAQTKRQKEPRVEKKKPNKYEQEIIDNLEN